MNRKDPQSRHPDSSAVIRPKVLERNQEFVIKLEGWTEFASSSVEVHIGVTSPASYLSFRPLRAQLDAFGGGSLTVPEGFNLEMLRGVQVAHFTCGERALTPANNQAALLNWDGPALSDDGVQLVQRDLSSQNKVLYGSPVGDPSDPTNLLHRAVTLLTGVLTTQHNIYPGLITIPRDATQRHRHLASSAVARKACSRDLQDAWQCQSSVYIVTPVGRNLQKTVEHSGPRGRQRRPFNPNGNQRQ